MSDEHELKRQADRGDRAKRLLENELINEAFDKIESEIMDAWRNSPADAEQERYNAYLMYRLLMNFKGQFKQAVAHGEAASKQLLQIRDPSKFKRMING